MARAAFLRYWVRLPACASMPRSSHRVLTMPALTYLPAALWDWQARNGRLPTEDDTEAPVELKQAADNLLTSWGVSLAAIPDVADITQCVLRALVTGRGCSH